MKKTIFILALITNFSFANKENKSFLSFQIVNTSIESIYAESISIQNLILFDTNINIQVKDLPVNIKLLPQKIENDGMPSLEYIYKDNIIVLDSYNDSDPNGTYIRMKIQNKEVNLKMQKSLCSKFKRVYSSNEYRVTFFEITFGECAGEMGQEIKGKLLIQTKNEQNTVNFEGVDSLFPDKKCEGLGNG